MEKWIKAAERCYSDEDSSASDFSFSAGLPPRESRDEFVGENVKASSWSRGDETYLMAAGPCAPAGEEDVQDKLEAVFERLIGPGEATLYAAREIAVDDMYGIEICGGAELEEGEETVFYAAYLSDGKEGFFLSGFGTGDAENVFDELSGAARTFYRMPAPATILKGKNFDPLFVALRELSEETLPVSVAGWDIINTTFQIENGRFVGEPSVIIISGETAEAWEAEDVFGDKSFAESVAALLDLVPGAYDISGFTVTCFSDGRYGVTYYPYFDEAEEEEGEHSHAHLHPRSEGDEEMTPLEPVFARLGGVMAKAFGEGWKYGMGILTAEGEYFSVTSFSSDGGPFKTAEIPEELDETLSGVLNELAEVVEESYGGWNALGFVFAPGENPAEVSEDTVTYEIFDFDIYLDAADEEQDKDTEYLLPAADLFYEELNESDGCVSAVTFKIAVGEDGPFVIEPAAASTPEGMKRVASFETAMPQIFSYAEEIFAGNADFNTVSVSLFPAGKAGFSLSRTETPVVVNRKNLTELLGETGLLKYEGHIKSLLRDEILAIVYEVDAEEALYPRVSKIGGSPDLPRNVQWPAGADKTPLSFVAQINLAEVSPFDKDGMLPKEGLLSFFFLERTGECAVIHTPAGTDTGLHVSEFDEEGAEEFMPARLRFVPSVSLPAFGETDASPDLDFLKNEEEEEAYADIAVSAGKTKMFGYADALSAEMESTYPEKVTLLFQAASLDECDMRWGDAGTLYFWIKDDDLRAGRFERAWCVMQSY